MGKMSYEKGEPKLIMSSNIYGYSGFSFFRISLRLSRFITQHSLESHCIISLNCLKDIPKYVLFLYKIKIISVFNKTEENMENFNRDLESIRYGRTETF